MAKAPITSNVHQALDIHRNLPPEIALNTHFLIDYFANSIDLIIGQVAHAGIGIDIGSSQDLLAGVQPDSENVWQRRFDPLVARKIDS